MMPPRRSDRRNSSRRGAALVAVLLLLVLMLALTLYYMALIRLEGQTTNAYGARRIAAQDFASALAEAQHDIRLSLGTSVVASPDVTSQWRSTGQGPATALVAATTAEDLGWPLELRGNQPGGLFDLASRAEWSVSGDTNGFHSAAAWVAVDLSGLLDPDALEGLDTAHLDFDPLGDTNRVYLSAREFVLVHSNSWPVFVPGSFSRDRGWFDVDLFTWRTNTVVGAETLPLDPREWTREQSLAVFSELYPEYDAEVLTTAFLDFRDAREVPSDPLGLSAVPVPMFNEVWGSLTVTNLGERVALDIRIDLELWRPYPGNPSTNRYRVPQTPELNFFHPDSAALGYDPADIGGKWEFTAPGGTVSNAFQRLEARFFSDNALLAPGAVIALGFELEGLRVEQLDGTAVDVLPAGLRLRFPDVAVPPSGQVERVERGLEVTDPRINHLESSWVEVITNSLQRINAAARAVPLPHDGFASWTPAGRSNEWQSAWIGHLPLPEPWRSVDLFDEEGRWWLRHTRDAGTELGQWRRGLVNPNSLHTAAVASVWIGAAFEQWPGEVDAPRVTEEQALDLALGLRNGVLSNQGAEQRGDWTATMGALATEGVPLRGFHAEESLIRHALPRLETSQQLVGIVLAVERRAPGGRVLAQRREALVWWRDPYGMTNETAAGRILWRTSLARDR